MRELASEALDRLATDDSARLGRLVASRGMGGGRLFEAVLVSSEGALAGRLLGGLADEAVAATDAPGLIEIELGTDDAIAAGLSCGGAATVLVSDKGSLPLEGLAELAEGRPVVFVTFLAKAHSEASSYSGWREVETEHGSLEGELAARARELARQALRTGRDSARLTKEAGGVLVVEAYFPTTSLLVIGTGELVDAIATQARLLGWELSAREGLDDKTAEVISSLRPSDALVVLSHDETVDVPAISAALERRCYVGALGSRNTQARRREALKAGGLSEKEVALLHGPVGLDLGARTPEETAVAIVAEILAFHSGRDGQSLSSSSLPIHA